MHYKITHTTSYDYHKSLSLCHNIGRLIPRDTDRQICRSYRIDIDPQPTVMEEYNDFFGNRVFYFSIEHEHKNLKVTVHSEVEKTISPSMEIDLFDQAAWEMVHDRLLLPSPEFLDARQYIAETNMTLADTAIHQYALESFVGGRSFFDSAKDLMHRIYRDFRFVPGFTTISTPPAEFMRQRKGVCQDFAHLAIACVRSVGLPARDASGYIETLPAPGKVKLTGVDASHAWFSVFIPHSGWIDFDPTNNQIPGSQHITVGWGRDYADISPLKGVIIGSGPQHLSVQVDVRSEK